MAPDRASTGDGPGSGSDEPRPPLLRGREDEEGDFKAALENMLRGAYREWPNEAGFDGLDEERGPLELAVVGEIPAWAAGSLYRTGPGQSKVDNTPRGTYHISHWFDGLAHTHRFDIQPDSGGRARVMYSSRRQSEELARYIREQGGRPAGVSFGQRADPCMGFLSKFMSTFMAMVGKHIRPPRPRSLENVSVTVLPDLPGLPGLPAANGAGSEDRQDNDGLPARCWLATDTTILKEIDPVSLEPIGVTSQIAFHPDLRGPISCSHAQRDLDTGDVFNFNLEFARCAVYRVFRVSAATGETEILATIARPDVRSAYVHSFFLTRNYVVLCLPCSHYSWCGAKMLWEKNVVDAIDPHDPTRPVRWFVIDRRSGRGVVAELESDAAFFFHTVNAYEEEEEEGEEQEEEEVKKEHAKGGIGTSIVCDFIEYTSFDVIRTLYYDSLKNTDGAADKFYSDPETAPLAIPRLARYRLPLSPPPPSEEAEATPARAEKLMAIRGPHAGELPTINPAYATRKHRYVYSLPTRGLSTLVDTIAKTDTLTGQATLWDNPRGHTPGEAIFVARPGAAEEDDGVLLSVVLDGVGAESYLLCLDARTMKEMGRAEVGFALPLGFHGIMHQERGERREEGVT